MTSTATPTTGPSPNMPLAYVVLVLTPLFFSSNLIFGRATVSEVAPFTLAFLFLQKAVLFLLLLGLGFLGS